MRRVCALSPSRRHTGNGPRDWISSMRPSARSLATTLPAAPPVRCDGRFRAPSSRCEAAARSRRWVSVSFTESSIRLRRRLAPPPPKPRNGHEAGGAGFRRAIRARNGDSTARFTPECQFFLDHLVAGNGVVADLEAAVVLVERLDLLDLVGRRGFERVDAVHHAAQPIGAGNAVM